MSALDPPLHAIPAASLVAAARVAGSEAPLDLDEIGQRIVGSALRRFPVSGAALYRPDAAAKALLPVAAACRGPEAGLWRLDRLPRGDLPGERDLAEAPPVWCSDLREDPPGALPQRLRSDLLALGVRSLGAVPCRAGRDLLGVLLFLDPLPRRLGEGELALLSALGDQSALVLETALRHE